MKTAQHLLAERQVAQELCISLACLRRWRSLRQGPPFVKLGSAVRYRREDLDAFVRANLRPPLEDGQ